MARLRGKVWCVAGVLCMSVADGNLRGWTVRVGQLNTSSSTSFGYDGGGTGALSFTAAQTELLSSLSDWIHWVDAGFDGVGLQGPHHRQPRRMRRVWLWGRRRAVLRRSVAVGRASGSGFGSSGGGGGVTARWVVRRRWAAGGGGGGNWLSESPVL
ncbi:hypothetical protein DFJ73DRAFT_959623 [Zopfochytrium polystomum]|nr:hypothetical protein DFJ73DRAFT_959623 [Zopfochytrium polystomum]